MRRTQLRRKTPLRRSPMRRGAKRSRYASRERAWEYMGWIRTQTCIVVSFGTGIVLAGADVVTRMAAAALVGPGRCSGPIEADHAGERIAGKDTKSLDRDVIPICNGHHRHRTESKGIFALMTKEQRREWRVAAVAHTHRLAASCGVEVPTC